MLSFILVSSSSSFFVVAFLWIYNYIYYIIFFTFSFFFQYSFDFCVLCSFRRMYCQYIHAQRSTQLTHANRYTVRSYKYHSFSSMALAFCYFDFFFLYIPSSLDVFPHNVLTDSREREIIFYCVLCAL